MLYFVLLFGIAPGVYKVVKKKKAKKRKRSKVMAKLEREGVDVALLQETHLTEQEHQKLQSWNFNQYSSSILISSNLVFECTDEKKDREGRFVFILGKLAGC